MQNLKKLIKQCIKGDRKAQKVLYENHYQFLMSICYRYQHNYQDAVSLTNQAFLKIITNLETYDTTQPFLPWIKRITINVAIDHIRKNRRIDGQTIFLEDSTQDPESDFTEEELHDLPELIYEDYIEMMNALEEPTRTIFNLYAIDDLKHKEIADKLGISERSSKRYLSYARKALKGMISEKKKILKRA